MTNDEKLYSRLMPLDEGAEWIGVATRTLREWIQLGRVESHKLYGRRLISEDEIIRLIELSRIPAVNKTRPRVKSLTTKTHDRAIDR